MPSTETEPTTTRHLYRPTRAAARELLRALGLKGHYVRRIEITFDVHDAVEVKVYEYADYERHTELVRVLAGYDWHEVSVEQVAPEATPDPDGIRDATALGDSIRQHAQAEPD